MAYMIAMVNIACKHYTSVRYKGASYSSESPEVIKRMCDTHNVSIFVCRTHIHVLPLAGLATTSVIMISDMKIWYIYFLLP